jgi:diguanylate cyclase (GGDEF)-like protein
MSVLTRLEQRGRLAVKIAVPLVVIIVAMAVVVGATTIAATRQSYAHTYARQAEGLADLVATGYVRYPEDQVAMTAFLTDVWASVPTVRLIRLFRENSGTPVLWASTNPAELKSYQPTAEEMSPIKTSIGIQREFNFRGERMLETIEPVRRDGRRVVASVGVLTSLQERDQAVAGVARTVGLLLALGVIGGLVALWAIFYRLVLRRMARLSRAASQVAQGDLDIRLPEGDQRAGGDEVFQVARQFDHMLGTIRSRTQQQAAVTRLGQRALEGADLASLLEETTTLVLRNLGADTASVERHMPQSGTFALVAGVGWNEGVVGRITVPAKESLAGYTLESDEPVIVNNYGAENRFKVSPFHREHHLVSAISVIIPGHDQPYGVLTAHTIRERTFTTDDLQFLQGMANTLGWAIRQKYAQEQLREARVLEMIAKNEPLEAILNTLVDTVEAQRPGAICAIMLAQGRSLHQVAGRRLPDAYLQAIAGAPIGADSSLAGVSAHRGQPVVIEDIGQDDFWREREGLALSLGLRAGWAVPLLSSAGRALGSMVTYQRKPATPSADDLRLLDDITYLATIAVEQRSLMDKLAYQAQHDALTGLPNRVLFEDRLQQAIAQAARSGEGVALLYVDLNDFKRINDTLGHHVGDVLLRLVAQRFKSRVRQSDTLARMGGDEFGVVLTGLKDPTKAAGVAQKLHDALVSAFDVNDMQLFLSGSIGISLYPQDGQEVGVLQRNADTAMYRAKLEGGAGFRFFAPEMHAEALERLEFDTSLRSALANKELKLHYQPQFSLETKEIVGVEALLRWAHPKYGPIPPTKFIPLAEETGLILPIGTWVLKEACRQNLAWQLAGYRPIRISVNVAPLQFGRPDFVKTVSDALGESGLDPQWLELEVTEGTLMRDVADVRGRLMELQRLGVRISIDDFGTGYSSLSYLQQLPIDSLKVDRSFVRDVTFPATEPDHGRSLVKSIVSLAHSLGMEVVAEGIETVDQLEFLRTLQCETGQGYLVAKPMPADQVVHMLSPLASASELEQSA